MHGFTNAQFARTLVRINAAGTECHADELQRWKTQRNIRWYLEGGKRVAYRARAIAAGGLLAAKGSFSW